MHVSESGTERVRREALARQAIVTSLGTDDGEYAADLFVSHHLAELDPSYWLEHFDIVRPEPVEILQSLRLLTDSDEYAGELDTLDFGLPGDVSDYLLCVRFDESGAVEEIEMES